MVMENLIQRRYEEEEEEDENDHQHCQNPALLSVVTETREYRINAWPIRNALRRASAIEDDVPTVQGPQLGKNKYVVRLINLLLLRGFSLTDFYIYFNLFIKQNVFY